ncbi:MAG: enoyl-CoA hydratase [Rhizobiales bacterium]|nr:enoyl-CoA hydratase [Hyphomicrobiales bacterium]
MPQAAYEAILVERRGPVGLVTLNRPKVLNALNEQLIGELARALKDFDADPNVAAIVMTGGEKAFAAGADIREMRDKTYIGNYLGRFLADWDAIAAQRKPLIAAVAGFALGGGCELAMICDIIIAAESAKFGQPEITIGIMPGAGGTQRLARAVGKAKAMDIILTGRMVEAAEAERCGLVSRVVADDRLLPEALEVAERIASFSHPIVQMAKESIGRAFETGLAEGVRFERRLFQAMFATEDQKEGMSAFIEKRKPVFRNR